MAKNKTVLRHPDGRKYTTSDRTEINQLKAAGYKVEAAKSAPKPVAKPAQKTQK